MLIALAQIEFKPGKGTPLRKLCAAGVQYGWDELTRGTKADLLAQTSAKARTSLRRDLQQTLERITRPCLELESTSFVLATESLGLAPTSDRNAGERMFLRDQPSYRLRLLFGRFPVLARLWALAIDQWRDHIDEVLERVQHDRDAISHLFFDDRHLGRIGDMRLGLSDPHHHGRSVTFLQFDSGGLIYKPRSGRGEAAWFELLQWMNSHGLVPKLRGARVLERDSYSWMEYVEAASCNDRAAVERFYERLGAMIAAAYLLKAVDCHRQNVIAAGEDPVLVDIDALWHVSPVTKTQEPADLLYRTGFFPSRRRRSLQSRSSVLGWNSTGQHLARVKGRPAIASDYAEEIVRGFAAGWQCLVGTSGRHAAFRKMVRRIRSRPRRWIYLATERYATMRKASLSPAAMQSEVAREGLLTRLVSRRSVGRSVHQAEVKALRQLDLPYFVRKTSEAMPGDNPSVPLEIVAAIRDALRGAR